MANMQSVKKVVQSKLAEKGQDLALPVVQEVIGAVLSSIEEVLAAEKGSLRTEIGTFALRASKARNGRNPSTGEALQIPARETITLKSRYRKEI